MYFKVFCWMDRWHGLTMADIRAIEDKTKEELDRVIKKFDLFYLKKFIIKITLLQ